MNGSRRAIISLIALCLATGCVGEMGSDAPLETWHQMAAKADGADLADADPVRIALMQARKDLPSTDYWSLVSDGTVQPETPDHTTLSGFVRQGVLISVEDKTQGLDEGAFRAWRYHIGGNVGPVNVAEGARSVTVPFGFKAGSRVEFAKAFESSHAASFADTPTLMDLPHNAKSALELPEGMVVSMPINARMSVDVNGRFLTKTANKSADFRPFLSSSAVGTTSGLRQGTLLVDGDMMLQVIRLKGSRVRLRVMTGNTVDIGGNMNLTAMGFAYYNFVPTTSIDRAIAIKTRVETAGQRIRRFQSLRERVHNFQATLNSKLELLLNITGLNEENVAGEAIRDLASFTLDKAFGLAEAAGPVLGLMDAVTAFADNRLKDVLGFWNRRIEPVTRRIRNLSSRAYNISGAIQLSDSFARTVRTVADYEFDLEDPDASHAFNRAISGRAIWLDATTGATQPTKPLADLTLADAIAAEDVAANHRRVIRHATVSNDLRKRHFGIKLSGLWMFAGLDWDQTANEVTLIDDQGFETTWEARTWQLQRQASWIGDHISESFASGAFVESGQDDLMGGGYWFSWKKVHTKSAQKPVARALAEFMNLLGPVAVKAGIPALYDGEYEGRVTAELDVIFSNSSLDGLFNPAKTPDTILWSVFGDVAEQFDNHFGLPLAICPIRPKVLDTIPGGHEACEKVAKAFGGYYCMFFADTFVPALRAAQEANDPTARIDFLETFYKKGVFDNPIGSRILVRYVASLLDAQGLGEGISIRAKISNEEDSSEAASPSLEFGDPSVLALIETMGPEGLK